MSDPHPPPADIIKLLLLVQSAAAAALGTFGQILRVPPFVAIFHPSDPLVFLNQALPDGEPREEGLDAPVEATIEAFRRRDRYPRFEFSRDLWPALPGVMERHGLRRQSVVPVMVCTRAELRPHRAEGATVRWLHPRDDRAFLAEVITVRRR